jgi:hypothetical protein
MFLDKTEGLTASMKIRAHTPGVSDAFVIHESHTLGTGLGHEWHPQEASSVDDWPVESDCHPEASSSTAALA